MPESAIQPGDPAIERRLRDALEGEVRFDAFTRGLYSTDASHYQVEPLGVVFPKTIADVEAAFEIARECGAPLLPRGGGTSQCGQTIGRAIVLDTNRHLRAIGGVEGIGGDGAAGVGDGGIAGGGAQGAAGVGSDRLTIEVEPGVVLDQLNHALAPHGLWFPVDPSTGSRATLGGMAGNNSAGARSIRYGMMVDNVTALEVLLPDGRRLWIGEGGSEAKTMPRELQALRALYAREAEEIARRTPNTMRNVAGYNLDRLAPEAENLARLLVGSEGSLAFFSRIRLALSPRPRTTALGVCHFPDLLSALDSVQHLVGLEPSAVELVDGNVLRLAHQRPTYRSALSTFVRGTPGSLLLVEFASPDPGADLSGRLDALEERLADLGQPGSLVRATTPEAQAAVWSVRKAGLNIVMSMSGPRKPISFIEDCAVPLEHLAEYARSVEEIFARHGTDGTWYAHASVGCLHVRPALDLKDPDDVGKVRRIAEETHEVVRRLGGTHSGEHGDGILRSEFLETMLGRRMAEAYAEVKRTFDPEGLMNPGKIVDPPRMDDRLLFRYGPRYVERPLPVVLDWSPSGGLLGAVERCNNNGACRKIDPGVMCPSFRVTLDERHSTRGRANALRLALTGQLGDDGLDTPEMAEAMGLCISCKGCRSECPTGVDMARMKLEWKHRQNQRRGVPLRERVLAGLPRMAPYAHRAGPLLDAMGRTPLVRALGLSTKRHLPAWSRDPWKDPESTTPGRGPARHGEVVLFVDTFTRWFEPENARASRRVLEAGGWRVRGTEPSGSAGRRPLCCGRTYLSAGMLDEARVEASRLIDALLPAAEAGHAIVGLEPSCLYTLTDEIPALLPGPAPTRVAERAVLLEEFLEAEWLEGRTIAFRTGEPRPVAVHGHCHQKACGDPRATPDILRRVPGLSVTPIDSGCCGMAGAFGYHAEHHETSMAMGELALFPAVRDAGARTRIVANGTSCRAQIRDGTGRPAVHPAVVLAEAIEG